jgi:hypothetical protein
MPRKLILLLFALVLIPQQAHSYSVQTHEQIIDLVWLNSIQPILLARYPATTPAQLQTAHAYAYGGSAIQDIGYYPFGNAFFSDLTHYVRSGDFVLSLLRNASNVNELAFAIGALSHYLGDTYGHSLCVNLSVPVEFPSLARKYGPDVTYEENEHAHVRTEFAFDVDQIAHRRFAPLAYLRHVGLQVPQALLARAFFETYGLNLQQIIGRHHNVLRSYTFAVRTFLPRIAYAENLLHRRHEPADTPGPQLDQLLADLTQAATDNHWAPYRKKPGLITYSLATLIVVLPKIGPLSDLAIRGPVPSTEDLYVQSLNTTLLHFRAILKDAPHLSTAVLPNRDLDTGAPVRPGSYRLTDQTFAQLLNRIVQTPTQPVPSTLKHDILAYYADPAAPISTRKHPKQWAQVQTNLTTLRAIPTIPITP